MINTAAPLVSICIPTLRGRGRLERCRASISAFTAHIDHEIVVIDSGSRTRGFTVPMNQALRAARGQVLIAMNDDVEVTAGWIDPLLGAVADGAWMAAPDQRSTDGDQVMCGWCIAFPRSALEVDLGQFDEQFVFWCSEIDMARRAIMSGHPPVRVQLPTPLYHVPSQTPREDGLEQDAQEDLVRYEAKWGVSALVDKTQLRSVDW